MGGLQNVDLDETKDAFHSRPCLEEVRACGECKALPNPPALECGQVCQETQANHYILLRPSLYIADLMPERKQH
jgi:hypothetical protein